MTLTLKVVPRAKRTEFAGEMADGSLKVRVAAVPEDGRANLELRRFLASHYGVALEAVAIVAGAGSTRKVVRVGRD
jgi:uncharacterized protein YggU (UPF0235/DUF167 family)